MAQINKPSAPLVPPTTDADVENIVNEAIASDDTHASLVNGEVPSTQLPSYVDDVLEFDAADEFPAEGETGKIYVALDTNYTYRWSGAAYVQVGGASLGEGNGIVIENDLINVDENYLNEHLDFQAPIEDLDDIRSGAALGATAVQELPVNGRGISAGSDASGATIWALDDSVVESIIDSRMSTYRDDPDSDLCKAVQDGLETLATVATSGAYSDLSGTPDLTTKQDTLISGTNIKTINGESILGSGDLEVSNVAEYNSGVTGEENVVYIDKQNQKAYRYDSVNSIYVPLICDLEISFSSLDSNPTLTTESSKLLASPAIAKPYKAYFASYRVISTSPNSVGLAFIRYNGDGTKGFFSVIEPFFDLWESDHYFSSLRVSDYELKINTSSHTTTLTRKSTNSLLRMYTNRDKSWDITPVANSTKPVISGGIYTALQAKADASAVYTKSEVDSAIAAAIGDVLNQGF